MKNQGGKNMVKAHTRKVKRSSKRAKKTPGKSFKYTKVKSHKRG